MNVAIKWPSDNTYLCFFMCNILFFLLYFGSELAEPTLHRIGGYENQMRIALYRSRVFVGIEKSLLSIPSLRKMVGTLQEQRTRRSARVNGAMDRQNIDDRKRTTVANTHIRMMFVSACQRIYLNCVVRIFSACLCLCLNVIFEFYVSIDAAIERWKNGESKCVCVCTWLYLDVNIDIGFFRVEFDKYRLY